MSACYNKLYDMVPEPEKHPFVIGLGRLREISGKWDEAISLYENWLLTADALIFLQQKAECKTALGNCLLLKGSYDEAMAYLKRAYLEFEWSVNQSGNLLCSLRYGWRTNGDRRRYRLTGARLSEAWRLRADESVHWLRHA